MGRSKRRKTGRQSALQRVRCVLREFRVQPRLKHVPWVASEAGVMREQSRDAILRLVAENVKKTSLEVKKQAVFEVLPKTTIDCQPNQPIVIRRGIIQPPVNLGARPR